MNRLSDEQLNKISSLVREIEKLSDIEKLLLYLKLPCGRSESQDAKTRTNGKVGADIFAKKPDQETTQTYTWILSHLEEDPTVSLPKQEVYDEYKAFCQINRLEPLCVADFGKAMKHVFPCIKPRRLGQRGNSRYCYSGLRKRFKIQPPSLPELSACSNSNTSNNIGNNNNGNYCCQPIEPCNQQQQPRPHQQPAYLDHLGTGMQTQDYHQTQQHSHLCQSIGSTITQQQFSTYEVMNLKIEPNDDQQMGPQQHHPNDNHLQQQQSADSNGHLSGQCNNVFRNSPQNADSDGNNCVSNNNNCQCNHSTNKLIMDGTMGNNNNNSSTMHQQPTQVPPVTCGDNFAMGPNNQQPTRTTTSHLYNNQYNHSSIMQLRPGTPDDDDYVHNYQNFTSIDTDRHLMSVSMHPLAQVQPPPPPPPPQQQSVPNNTTQQQTTTNSQNIDNLNSCCRSTAPDIYNQQQPQPQGTAPSSPINIATGINNVATSSPPHPQQALINLPKMSTNNGNEPQPILHPQQLHHSQGPQRIHHHQQNLSPTNSSFIQYQGLPASLRLHLTELGNPNIDYVSASPFQSPSTTPNLIGMSTGGGGSSSSSTASGSSGISNHHISQNIQPTGGYYSTTGCLRYIN